MIFKGKKDPLMSSHLTAAANQSAADSRGPLSPAAQKAYEAAQEYGSHFGSAMYPFYGVNRIENKGVSFDPGRNRVCMLITINVSRSHPNGHEADEDHSFRLTKNELKQLSRCSDFPRKYDFLLLSADDGFHVQEKAAKPDATKLGK